ncbi:carbohydrate kinase family protein [Verrucomicrobiaceae bacterium R5-34]|nr:carbohydrate kinase family protein [Verrucomicrobiaceae bacterium R5-34]
MKKSDPAYPPLLAVGTFVVDYQKVVDHYPDERSATRVSREMVSNGGAPLNTLINLAKLRVPFPLFAAAKVGKDLDGKFIVDCCTEHKIDTSQLQPVEGESTGYTDVYTVEKTGKHTCFHFCGIGETFSRADVKLRAVKPKILLLGSLGALGKMDNHNPEYGRSGAAQLLRDAKKQGITTVVEIAPVDQQAKLDDFTEALSQADYLIINDRVAESILNQELYSENQFDADLAKDACEQLLKTGLHKAVILQCGTAAVYLDTEGNFYHQTGYFLPWSQRVGSAGVDHAFVAGFLEGLYLEKAVETSLQQGLAVSTTCRRDLTPSGGLAPLDECMAFCEQLDIKAAS